MGKFYGVKNGMIEMPNKYPRIFSSTTWTNLLALGVSGTALLNPATGLRSCVMEEVCRCRGVFTGVRSILNHIPMNWRILQGGPSQK